jgi:hypothetical protein
MRVSFNIVAGSTLALVLGLLVSPDALAASAGADSPPWVIGNGQTDAGLFVPREVQQTYAKGTRSQDGRPGPNYWQNHAAHRIRISLSPPSRRVQGEQEIVYTNNSPEPMTNLIFRLYLNAHHPAALREKPVSEKFLTDGITVDEFSIDGKAVPWDNSTDPLRVYNVPGGTIHAMTLGAPAPTKGIVTIRMRWHYDLVADSGWKEGAIDDTTYFLAYFLSARHQLQRLQRLGFHAVYAGPRIQQRLRGFQGRRGRAARFRRVGHGHAAEREGCAAARRAPQARGELQERQGRYAGGSRGREVRQGHRTRRTPDVEVAGGPCARLRHRRQQQLSLGCRERRR